MISFGRHICNDFNIAKEKEWLLTNNKGSYSSSTIILTNTRKHHGLLVAKVPNIDNRLIIFPNTDEEVEITGHIYHISTHQYKRTIYPQGYFYLENFLLKDDVATFVYLIENIRLKKEIFIMKNKNTVVVNYTILTPGSYAKIRIKPFIAFREPEQLIKEIEFFEPEIKRHSDEKIEISVFKNLPSGYIYLPDKANVIFEGIWYREFFYLRENQSGFLDSEDLYTIGTIELELEFNKPKAIYYSTEPDETLNKEQMFKIFKEQQKEQIEICIKKGACINSEDYRSAIRQLMLAAETFVMEDDQKIPLIISGYHWPNYIWFRDMYAALPGILLIREKFDQAKKLLSETIKLEQNGLLPLNMTFNRNDIKYFSVDSSLWYFYALYKYLIYTDDFDIVKNDSEIYKRLTWIIHKYIEGTNFNIYMDKNDNLIYAGFPETPLTWMDSKTLNGLAVTPRMGKTVEINALWYNAIKIMEFICKKIGNESAKSYEELGEKIYKNFNEKFWNEDAGCLYDFFDGEYKNKDIRPNQILALSLPFELVTDHNKKEKIMNIIIKELYTSFGLRTLSNMDINFKPKCDGDLNSRQIALHQGSVWPWTIGHFITAYFRTYGKNTESIQFVETVYEPIFEHLKTSGLGTISEIFDGSFPYIARGRISHAWAVGEILRSYFEDFLGGNNNK